MRLRAVMGIAKTKTICWSCSAAQPSFKKDGLKIQAEFKEAAEDHDDRELHALHRLLDGPILPALMCLLVGHRIERRNRHGLAMGNPDLRRHVILHHPRGVDRHVDVDGLHLGGDVEVVAQPPDVLAPRPLRQLDGLLRLAHVGADDAESAAAGRVEQIQLAERGLGNVLVVAWVVARRIARVGEEGRDAVDLEGLHVGCVQAARPEAGHVHQ